MTRLVLDSGAYSAWSKGIEIDLDQYIDFLLDRADSIWGPVGLDVIPGRLGLERTSTQTEEAARRTYINVSEMRRAGVRNVIPVFHQGERLDWLSRYIDDGFDYVGISPSKALSNRYKIKWLDDVFDFLCGSEGFPPIKTHAFGETAHSILFRYPWASADSTSWSIPASMGWVFVPPQKENGDFDFESSWFMLPLSDGGKNGKPILSGESYKRYETMGEDRREYLDSYFGSMGFSTDEIRSETIVRQRCNVRYYEQVRKHWTRKPFERSRIGLFNRDRRSVGVSEYKFEEGLAFVFAASTTILPMLLEEKVGHVLLSYAAIRSSRKLDFSAFTPTKLRLPSPK